MSKQLSAILLLGSLACTGQGARVTIKRVLQESNTAEVNSLLSASTCATLEDKIQRLSEYVPTKVKKLETKGLGGWRGTARIIKLSRKSNALAAAISSFEQEGCAGDLTTAKEHLVSVSTQIKQLALDGGETTASLATAIAEAETKLAAERAKPQGEQDIGSIQAEFLRTILGGSGEMTDREKDELLCKEGTCQTDDILNEIMAEGDSDGLSANETETLKLNERDTSLIDVSMTTEVAGKNPFLTALIGFSRFVCKIVLGLVGVVWFLTTGALYFIGGFLGFVGNIVATIACAMWWLLGQFVELVSWGHMKFGEDTKKCHKTIWKKGIVKPSMTAYDEIKKANPWNWMDEVDDRLIEADRQGF